MLNDGEFYDSNISALIAMRPIHKLFKATWGKKPEERYPFHFIYAIPFIRKLVYDI